MKYRQGPKHVNTLKNVEKKLLFPMGHFRESKVSIELMFKMTNFWLAELNWAWIHTCVPVSRIEVTDFF